MTGNTRLSLSVFVVLVCIHFSRLRDNSTVTLSLSCAEHKFHELPEVRDLVYIGLRGGERSDTARTASKRMQLAVIFSHSFPFTSLKAS